MLLANYLINMTSCKVHWLLRDVICYPTVCCLCRYSGFESEVERLRIMKKVRVCEDCYKNLRPKQS